MFIEYSFCKLYVAIPLSARASSRVTCQTISSFVLVADMPVQIQQPCALNFNHPDLFSCFCYESDTSSLPPPPLPEQMRFHMFITVFIASCLYCCSSPIPQFTHVCILLSGTYFYRTDPRPNMWNCYDFIKLSTLFLLAFLV